MSASLGSSGLVLSLLYLGIGSIAAFLIHRASTEVGMARWLHALIAVPLWPLWAPVVLRERAPAPHRSVHARTAQRIVASLREGGEAVKASPLEALLPASAIERITNEVRRLAERADEIELLLTKPELDRLRTVARITALEAKGEAGRTLAAARLHLDNILRLEGVLAHDREALDELADLCAALRTQLVLARHAGSSAAGVGDIVSEVNARIAGLGEAMDASV